VNDGGDTVIVLDGCEMSGGSTVMLVAGTVIGCAPINMDNSFVWGVLMETLTGNINNSLSMPE